MGENQQFLSAMRMLDTVRGPDRTGLRAVSRVACGRVRAQGGYYAPYNRSMFVGIKT